MHGRCRWKVERSCASQYAIAGCSSALPASAHPTAPALARCEAFTVRHCRSRSVGVRYRDTAYHQSLLTIRMQYMRVAAPTPSFSVSVVFCGPKLQRSCCSSPDCTFEVQRLVSGDRRLADGACGRIRLRVKVRRSIGWLPTRSRAPNASPMWRRRRGATW